MCCSLQLQPTYKQSSVKPLMQLYAAFISSYITDDLMTSKQVNAQEVIEKALEPWRSLSTTSQLLTSPVMPPKESMMPRHSDDVT